ncbi:hypothetical protein KC960_03845 [Candidatus Saccharibacteria bacterium]|nr:hypothetical protein [Candidatus Saccharibacteria bacterium]
MWDFIITGYFPGTDIQVSFDMIAVFALSFLTTLLLISLAKHHKSFRKEIAFIIQRNNSERIREISL